MVISGDPESSDEGSPDIIITTRDRDRNAFSRISTTVFRFFTHQFCTVNMCK